MNKLGVFVASHNNPLFLRHCLLQLLAQDFKAVSVLAIHENGQHDSGKLFWLDVLQALQNKGIKVIHDHTPVKVPQPLFHYLPLKALYDDGCELFTKWDHDDVFYDNHLSSLVTSYWQNHWSDKADYVVQTKADLLILKKSGDYVHRWAVDFGQWNPTGGMSDAILFNRAVAERYIDEMRKHPGKQDDAIMADDVMPHFKGVKLTGTPTSCYVSHGKNTSTAHWAICPPEIL